TDHLPHLLASPCLRSFLHPRLRVTRSVLSCSAYQRSRRVHRLVQPWPQYLPAAPMRESPQPRIGVYHTRVPYAIEERQIRDGIGVEEARGEIDPVLGGEPLGPVDLAPPVAHRLDPLAGEAPVAHDQLRDQVVLDPEIGPEWLRQIARGAGQD